LRPSDSPSGNARSATRVHFFVRQAFGVWSWGLVFVLSIAVLVLLLDCPAMSEPIFDHEKLNIYRVAIEYIAFSHPIAKSFRGDQRHLRDQWLRAAQSIPLKLGVQEAVFSLTTKSRPHAPSGSRFWRAQRGVVRHLGHEPGRSTSRGPNAFPGGKG
jgi:hypothetical protein